MLVMEHELFRHIEIGVFVTRPLLADSLTFIQQLVCYFDGDRDAFSSNTREQLEKLHMLNAADVGTYTHHYPIAVRRILPDDTLISMASDDHEDSCSISFNCYSRPSDRPAFNRFAEVLTHSTASLFRARPHWGKICPMNASIVKTLYAHLPEFQRVCADSDPTHVFRNEWVSQLLFSEDSNDRCR